MLEVNTKLYASAGLHTALYQTLLLKVQSKFIIQKG